MIIREIMNRAVYSCPSDHSLNDAARIMWDLDVGAVPVTDPRTGAICGMITDRDIAMAAYTQGRPLESIEVGQVMPEVQFASPDHDIAEAHERMRRHQVRRLPVLNEGHELVGFLSLNDLALAAGGGGTGQEEEVARTLAMISRHRNGDAAAHRAAAPEPAVTEQAALEATVEAARSGWSR